VPCVHISVFPFLSKVNMRVRNQPQSGAMARIAIRVRIDPCILCVNCSRPRELASQKHSCSICVLVSNDLPHLHMPSPFENFRCLYSSVMCMSHRCFILAARLVALFMRAFHLSYDGQSISVLPGTHSGLAFWRCCSV
jgi:hypothetical protein